ncbi:MAG: FecR family protein [bacterium]
MRRRLEELSEAYFDQTITPEECRHLDELLRDTDARKEFMRAAAMEVELPFALAEAPKRISDEVWKPLRPSMKAVFGASAVPGVPGAQAPIRPVSWRRIAFPSAIAAAAAVAIVSAVWYSTIYVRFQVPDAQLVANVIHVSGIVRVASLSEDDVVRLSIGDSVSPDCRMTVEPGAKITLGFPDGSRIQVMEKTRIMTSAGRKIRLIHLDSGILYATIAPQPEGRKLIFATPHALLRIVGTQFRLSADEKGSRVDVDEGKLVFTSKEDNRSIVVAGKDSAEANDVTSSPDRASGSR